jgi:hypothetical protein
MLVLRGVNKATLASVLIETECVGEDGKLVVAQTATGFIYRKSGSTFLITNWHVVTGRNPDNPLHMLINAHESPVRLTFYMPKMDNNKWFLPGRVPLYDNGRPEWIEINDDTCGRVDLVAIKIDFPSDCYVVAVQDFAEVEGELGVGDNVVVVGFPFGRYEKNPHAIWKRAMVASEPSLLLSGRSRYFLDVPGRQGMSGSPVYAIWDVLTLPAEAGRMMNDPSLDIIEKLRAVSPDDWGKGKALHLVGVYAGALAEGSECSLGLGFCWHSALIEEIFRNPRYGINPEPPPLGDY